MVETDRVVNLILFTLFIASKHTPANYSQARQIYPPCPSTSTFLWNIFRIVWRQPASQGLIYISSGIILLYADMGPGLFVSSKK